MTPLTDADALRVAQIEARLKRWDEMPSLFEAFRLGAVHDAAVFDALDTEYYDLRNAMPEDARWLLDKLRAATGGDMPY